MKTVNIRILMMFILGMAVTFTACNSGNKTEKTDKTGKEYTSKYVCPMHCPGSGGEEAGPCSVCGMDMIKNKNYKEEDVSTPEQSEVDDHEGHDHE